MYRVEWTYQCFTRRRRHQTSARVGGWGLSARETPTPYPTAAAASYSAEAGGEAAARGKPMCPAHKLLLSAEPWLSWRCPTLKPKTFQ